MLNTQKIENVKVVLNDFFEIANPDTFQKDLNDLLSMAMSSGAFEELESMERTNLIFRFLKCQEMIRSIHKFSDWS